jgi:hypothetical protein
MKLSLLVKAIPMLAVALLAPLAIFAQTSGEQKTVTGLVSDAMCGATHMMKDKPTEDCLRYCVKQGTKYALVVGKSV